MAAGVALAFATVIFEAHGLWLADPLALLTMGLIAGGAVLALVGGVMRPIQQVVFRRGIPGGRLRELVLRQAVLRWWYGIDGGGEGGRGNDVLIREGEERPLAAKSTHRLRPGDVVSIRTPGGGGFGDPADRDPAATTRDEELGKTTGEDFGED